MINLLPFDKSHAEPVKALSAAGYKVKILSKKHPYIDFRGT